MTGMSLKSPRIAMKNRDSQFMYRMPPIDAIYRPHVVHHTIMPPELKAQQVQNKNKRYFLAE